MVEIIPAIMPKSFKDIEVHTKRVRDDVPVVQLDIMDGKFVKGVTWPYTKGGEDEMKKLVRKEIHLPYSDVLDYEIDLMVSEPEHVIEDWMHAGASRIIIHIESTKKMKDIIRDVAAHVTRANDEDIEVVSLGVAINTTTATNSIDPYVEDIEFVQCMGIAEIGKQGEPYDEKVLDNLDAINSEHPELVLSVDGAVKDDNALELAKAGANRLVSGSFIFSADDSKTQINKLRDIIKNE